MPGNDLGPLIWSLMPLDWIWVLGMIALYYDFELDGTY